METKQDIPYLEVPTAPIAIMKETRKDGSILLHSQVPLETYPKTVTERLRYWAEIAPEKTMIAQRDVDGNWLKLSYAQVWEKVQRIGQFLLYSDANVERPVAVLSGNSWQHALLALAAQHVGIPFSAISPAYSLRSTDFRKLKHCLEVLTPGLIFVQDGEQFKKALEAVDIVCTLVTAKNEIGDSISFKTVLNTEITSEVAEANAKVEASTVAKILFTSGSTGMPKGVINTQGNLTCNLQQITQTYPFVKNGQLTLVDWLPWSHTFGGNHNFGLVFFNGGTLYIDDGNPSPEGTKVTVYNLKEIAPTVYFNVPKGFEELVTQLRTDEELCKHFFSKLKMLFFGGASLSQYVRDSLDELAIKSIGKRILISSGYGMTEACPSTMFNTRYDQLAGNLGVPVPGIKTKLVPYDDTFEVRFKGPNISPGYWRNPLQTSSAFDEEGYFKSADALKFADEVDPNSGLVYDGRITENFKLNSGTWVNVGIMRSKLIAASQGLVRDVVLTGRDRDFVGAILFLDYANCIAAAQLPSSSTLQMISKSKEVQLIIKEALAYLAGQGSGASTIIRRATIADFEPCVKKAEITDKGSINQRSVLMNRKALVNRLYELSEVDGVIEIERS